MEAGQRLYSEDIGEECTEQIASDLKMEEADLCRTGWALIEGVQMAQVLGREKRFTVALLVPNDKVSNDNEKRWGALLNALQLEDAGNVPVHDVRQTAAVDVPAVEGDDDGDGIGGESETKSEEDEGDD
ncbi:hypothetical protein Syun_018138 [Stephania yunnanensis]|uniref:Uncharacterized protein n=1 Tax=Stephania yunnanensis TaxID=152371 RepID=A0AAP0NY30_9MAGN